MGEYSTRDNLKQILEEQQRRQIQLKNKRQKQDSYVRPKNKVNFVRHRKKENKREEKDILSMKKKK